MSRICVVKNSFGISCITSARTIHPSKIGEFGGSALTRDNKLKLPKFFNTPLEEEGKKKPSKRKRDSLKSMSVRTKAKIRKKIIAFSMVCPKLSFLTLTFCNKVDDETAIKVFRSFLDNAKNRMTDLEYLWVIERQEENETFKDNVHFHLVTNKFWKIDKWWPYWKDVQARFGVVPREENFNPSSAFDVKKINSNNIKGIMNYMTKYVTKNKARYQCQVWNCSKRISRLYTDFYSDLSIVHYLEKLESQNMLGGELKRISKEFCNLLLIPLNQITMRLYERLKLKNLEIWNQPYKKEVAHV